MQALVPIGIVVGAFLLFSIFWVSITQLVGVISGWKKLASHYPDREDVNGKALRFQSAKIGYLQYNNCLTFVMVEEGFRLSSMIFFRIGHPPLFIPWGDCHKPKAVASLFTEFVQIELGDPRITTITIPRSILEQKPTR